MKTIWQGSLSFGLVTFPVALYSASKKHGLSFNLFHRKDKAPIRYARICEKEEKEIPWEEIVKGYELEEGKFIFLEEQDFESANIEKASSIDIFGFVDISKIDTIFYDKPYYLTAQKGGAKAYYLFLDALKAAKKVALCHFVLRHHEYIGIIQPFKELLILEQLHYLDALQPTKELSLYHPQKSKKELNIAIKLIEEMEVTFDPQKYKDSYVDDLLKIIKQKAQGKKIQPQGQKRKLSKEKDLSALLEKSLKKEKYTYPRP